MLFNEKQDNLSLTFCQRSKPPITRQGSGLKQWRIREQNNNIKDAEKLHNWLIQITSFLYHTLPTPVAARSKAWVWGRSVSGIGISNPTGGMDICLLWVSCVVR